IPIVLKDNYETFDLPTTAGSQLLEGSIPSKDAFVVKKLRDAGVVILAKVNLSEFAGGGGIGTGAGRNRAADMPPSYRAYGAQSTMGGITLNPHDLTKSPAG